MEESQNVSWWLATKVTWSFTWRYLVWVLLLSFAAGIVNGLLMLIANLVFNMPKEHPLINLYLVISSLAIVVVLIINMVRRMLNKGEFNDFIFKAKQNQA
ncbi:MAG: hypothetical protein DI585_03470 [Pseudomonas fluorescens]|nr:MAG: hypothetical protein DI585_03470 [Pseudomonas fluorescens]